MALFSRYYTIELYIYYYAKDFKFNDEVHNKAKACSLSERRELSHHNHYT